MELLILGAVIGSNNFAAALALGALGQGYRRWRISVVFTCFEFVIPLLGIWLGAQVSRWLAAPADMIGPLLLAAIGIWSLVSGTRGPSYDERLARRAATWGGLVVLATLLSADNLIIGFSLGLRHISPLAIASLIATFSAVFTWLGLTVGTAARRSWERRAEIAAGALLLVVALAMWMGLID